MKEFEYKTKTLSDRHKIHFRKHSNRFFYFVTLDFFFRSVGFADVHLRNSYSSKLIFTFAFCHRLRCANPMIFFTFSSWFFFFFGLVFRFNNTKMENENEMEKSHERDRKEDREKKPNWQKRRTKSWKENEFNIIHIYILYIAQMQ